MLDSKKWDKAYIYIHDKHGVAADDAVSRVVYNIQGRTKTVTG